MMNTEITQRVGLIFADLATVTLLELNADSHELGKGAVERPELQAKSESRPYDIQNFPTAGNA